MTDTSALPSTITVNPSTGSVSISASYPKGVASIVVVGKLATNQTWSTTVTLACLLPYTVTVANISVPVLSTNKASNLAYSDPNGFTISMTGPFLQGTTSLPSFMTFSSNSLSYQP